MAAGEERPIAELVTGVDALEPCFGGEGPFGWAGALTAPLPTLEAAVGPLIGALTTSPQKEGVTVVVLFQGLLASGPCKNDFKNGEIGVSPKFDRCRLSGNILLKKSKSAVADGKALPFARTQLGHHVSLLIGSDFIS